MLALATPGVAVFPIGDTASWMSVDRTLGFCFGLLHDSLRESEGPMSPVGDGRTAFAAELRSECVLPLDDDSFGVLNEARVR